MFSKLSASAGKAAAKKKPLPAPAAEDSSGWTVHVTKAQKQKERRKALPGPAEAAPENVNPVHAEPATV